MIQLLELVFPSAVLISWNGLQLAVFCKSLHGRVAGAAGVLQTRSDLRVLTLHGAIHDGLEQAVMSQEVPYPGVSSFL